ncbi:hypothetical protein [Actinomadura litoris]|uniref:Secreted protein n=1 Tax=Actinomadura litoris TaxID=2678616 RepID=A0A7K1KXC8_9ACTN|nr:hypothetical protein [Actinomadura litoris]MUN36717.1 hypothetical protein [Actinomadura litoris]
MAAALALMATAAVTGVSPSVASAVPSSATGAAAPYRLTDLEMVRETGTVAPYEAKIAHCPPGKQPLGGGFELPIEHTVSASYPVADTGWVVKARSIKDDPTPFEMTWYAMCATPSPGYRIVKQTGIVPNGDNVGQTCSIFNYPYEYMVNVGGEAKGPTAALTTSSMWTNPSSTITYAGARGFRTDAGTVEIDVYAICATAYDGSTYWHNEWQSSYPNDRGPLWACPAGERSIGVTFRSNASLRSSKPHTIGESDWRVTALNPGVPGYDIEGGVVCAPRP